jgi:hypothetical protein
MSTQTGFAGFVSSTLAGATTNVRAVLNESWSFCTGNGRRREWAAWLEPGGWWTAASNDVAGLPGDFLEAAARRDSAVARALDSARTPFLTVSVPTDAPAELVAAIEDIHALDRIAHPEAEGDQPDLDWIREGLQETGWAVKAKGDRLATTFEAANSLFEASMSQSSQGRVAAEVKVCSFASCEPSSREAAAYALLRANALLRSVQGVILDIGGEESAGFVAMAPADATPTRLLSALHALGAACDCFARELRALRDPALAARYLELQGVSTQKEKTAHV